MEVNMKKVFFFLAGLVLLVCLFPSTISALGVAIGPTAFEITNALRGSEYERTITVFNPSTTTETHYNLSTDGQAASRHQGNRGIVLVRLISIRSAGSIINKFKRDI
jgi:P pilus assembly chaperone PapD